MAKSPQELRDEADKAESSGADKAEKLRDAAPLVKRVRLQIAAAHATPLAAALGFVLSRPEVDIAVVGATSRHELEETLASARAPLPALDWPACALDDARILTPSLW